MDGLGGWAVALKLLPLLPTNDIKPDTLSVLHHRTELGLATATKAVDLDKLIFGYNTIML